MTYTKMVIYQLLPRLFGNTNTTNIPNGSMAENGSGKFNDITLTVLKKLAESGYTHVWFTGVIAHATTTEYTEYGLPIDFPEIVKGKAGSPYAIRDYYDVDPDLAVDVDKRLDEFEALIDRAHEAGLKVIIDNVPNHLARQYKSFAKPNGVVDFGETDDVQYAFSPSNNFYYLPNESLQLSFLDNDKPHGSYLENPAKVTGNDCFSASPRVNDWYETVKLNYGVDYMNGRNECFDPIPNTWVKMRDVLLFWARLGVDAFRCDMAEMVPLAYWKWVIPQVKAKYRYIDFIAEIYNQDAYRSYLSDGAFDYLYDKVGLYDTLRDVSCGNKPASEITFALQKVGDIQHRMLNFLENHDEQRIASDFFLGDAAKAKAAMIVTTCVNTNPVMVYAGQELGEKGMDSEGFSGKDGRTTIFDYWGVDSLSRWNNNGAWNTKLLTKEEKSLKRFYSKLLNLCDTEPSLYNGLFYDLMYVNYFNLNFDSTKQYAFLRGTQHECILVVANFDNVDVDITVHLPQDVFSFFGLPSFQCIVVSPLLVGKKPQPVMDWQKIDVHLKANSGELFRIYFV